MKTILKSASAAIAIISFVGGVNAQTHTSSSTTYSNSTIQGYNNSYGTFGDAVWNAAQNGQVYAVTPTGSSQFDPASSGSRYKQTGTAPDNTEDAQTTVSNTFTLTGNVTKDCSFYGGGTTGHTIDLGTIGVRTGNNDNVSIAFNQVQAMTANVNSATAGCNFNNTVSIKKSNGSIGLQNQDPGSFDPAQFTDRIPYTISASWNGVALGGKTASQQVLQVSDQQSDNSKTSGAWRSAFNMDVNMPAQPKGLVAGTYKDTITVTLATI